MKLKILKCLDIAIEYSLYGLIFFIPISIALISTFAAIAIFLFLIKQIFSADFSSLKANKVFFLLLLIFFICMALSLINSGSLMHISLKALFLKWGRFPLILWVVLDTFKDPKRIVNAVCVFLFSSILVGLSIVSQKYFGLEFLRHRALLGNMITGPFENENDLAAYLTCLIPVAISFFLWKWKNFFIKTGFVLIVFLLIVCSIWTLCRGGWLGLAAGLISMPLLVNYKRLSKKIFWSLCCFGYFVCLPLITLALFHFQNRLDSARFILYHGAWHMIKEHPFLGKGLGTFMSYCAQYTNNFGVYYTHNDYLQMWAESGMFSLLSFLLLVVYVLHKSIKTIFKASASLEFFLLIGLTAGLIGALVHSAVEIHLYSFQLSFLFWVILGLTVALSSKLNINDIHKSPYKYL
ncbi:MAG: O-antigen ligase family protein [Candidatus Omnitrophota bacterium]